MFIVGHSTIYILIFLLAINIDITWFIHQEKSWKNQRPHEAPPDVLMTCRFRVPEADALTSAMDVFVAKMIQTAAIVTKDVQVET